MGAVDQFNRAALDLPGCNRNATRQWSTRPDRAGRNLPLHLHGYKHMEKDTAQRVVSYDEIKRVLVEEIGIDAADIRPDESFIQMGIDSLEMANLVLELEDAFGVEIPDDDLKTILTPNDVLAYVSANRN
jgi:acyl carrier protein